MFGLRLKEKQITFYNYSVTTTLFSRFSISSYNSFQPASFGHRALPFPTPCDYFNTTPLTKN